MKKTAVSEGSMVQLTRWMVGRWMPGCSIYKTRPAGKVGAKRNKRDGTLVDVGDVQLPLPLESEVLDDLYPPVRSQGMMQAPESLNPYVTTDTTTASSAIPAVKVAPAGPVVGSEVRS
jgi:hypothetical protein